MPTNTIPAVSSLLTDADASSFLIPSRIVADVVQTRRRDWLWKNVESTLKTHYHEPDLAAALAFYSCIAAHGLDGQPVWPMLVGPPGSMKTELLSGLHDEPHAHFIDQITPQTFISGYIRQNKSDDDRPSGLLHRIGKSGIVVYPDFSTVLAMKPDARASILADMRRIYDGELRKEFGTADSLKQRSWTGRITFAVGATPDVDRCYSVFQTLGERFVMIRWPRAGGIDAALAAMDQDSTTARSDLKSAVTALLASFQGRNPTMSRVFKRRLAALSELTVRARTAVPRDGYSKDIIYVPEPESSTRLAQQLCQATLGAALVLGDDEVGEQHINVARRIAFDCIPAGRRKILDHLIGGRPLKQLDMPAPTRSYYTADLQLQGVLEDDALSPLAIDMLTEANVLLGPAMVH